MKTTPLLKALISARDIVRYDLRNDATLVIADNAPMQPQTAHNAIKAGCDIKLAPVSSSLAVLVRHLADSGQKSAEKCGQERHWQTSIDFAFEYLLEELELMDEYNELD